MITYPNQTREKLLGMLAASPLLLSMGLSLATLFTLNQTTRA